MGLPLKFLRGFSEPSRHDATPLSPQRSALLRLCGLAPAYLSIPLPHDTEGVQGMPPQNMLLWHKDYFELKAIFKK